MDKSEIVKLDELDFKLLKELKTNSRRSIREFAKAINENPSTVYNRLNRLESTGVIKKWAVEINYSLLNLDVMFYIFISVDCEGCPDSDLKFNTSEVCDELKQIDGICEISMMTGDFDIFAKLRTDSIETTSEIIIDQIRTIPGVSKVVSNNCFETVLCECDIEEINSPTKVRSFVKYDKQSKSNNDLMNIYGETH